MKFDPESMTLEFDAIETYKDSEDNSIDVITRLCFSSYDITCVLSMENGSERHKSLGVKSAILVNAKCYWLRDSYEECLSVFKYTRRHHCKYNSAIMDINIKLLDKNAEIVALMEQLEAKIGSKK